MENTLYYERILDRHFAKFYFNRKVDSFCNIAKTKEMLDKLSDADFKLFTECVKFYNSIPCLNYSITDLALNIFPSFTPNVIKEWELFEEIFLLEKENNA